MPLLCPAVWTLIIFIANTNSSVKILFLRKTFFSPKDTITNPSECWKGQHVERTMSGWMTSSSHLCDLIPEQQIQPNGLRCFCYLCSLFPSESRRECWNFLRANPALTTFPSKHSCSTVVCRKLSMHPKFLKLLK